MAAHESSDARTEVDYLDPSANVDLNEQELAEIYSRPIMNPNHGKFGNKPQLNTLLQAEKTLIEQKHDKIVEIFRGGQEIFEILETAKRDPLLQSGA